MANASTSTTLAPTPASSRRSIRWSTSSRLAATSSTSICSPSASGSRIWKSSCTFAMSKGTYCSASQRITSRASSSRMRSIWIFFTMTSRPPTAVITCFTGEPRPLSTARMVSATSVGSMISPSTIASATRGR